MGHPRRPVDPTRPGPRVARADAEGGIQDPAGVGHLPQLEAPELVLRELSEFFGG